MSDEPTDLEIAIEEVGQTLTELNGFKEGFAVARNTDEPYILLRIANLLADYLILLKETQNDR